TLQDFGTMPIFKRTFAQDLDLLEQHLTKEIISQTDCKTILTKLRTKFENDFNSKFKERMQKYTRFNAQSFQDAMICNMDSFGKYMLEIILHQQRTPQLLKQKKLMQTQENHSNPIPALNVDSLKVDLVVIQNTYSEKEDNNSETASSKSVKESSLDSATKDVHAIKYKMSKAKERCMAYFRSLHSHLQVLSKEDLKGTRIEHGFKRAFMSLFGQDAGIHVTLCLLWIMTDKYFVEYTRIKVKHFKDTLLQHICNVKKSVAERIRKAVDADLVVIESSGTESEVQDDNSRSGNDTNADDAEIRPIYDEEPMVKVQLTAECNIFVIGQQHTEQPEIINESRVDQYPKQCQVKSLMLDSSPDNQTTDYSKQSLESENILLKKTVAQFQKDFSRMDKHINKAKEDYKERKAFETINIELEHSVAKLLTENEHLNKENESLKKHYKDLYDSIKITRSKTIEQTTSLLANNADLKDQIQEKVFAIAALKNDLRKLKGNSVDTKFAKTSVLGKPVLQSLRNQSVVRQSNAFKSERPQMSKPWFASQVDVSNNLSKPVTQHYLPKRRESVSAKPDHMIASSESRDSSKNVPRFSSNDMVHNHYLDEARKKTQERDRNSKTNVIPYARFQSTVDGSKPKPRSTNHSTIFTSHRFSSNKTSAVYEKTSLRSYLRWKPTGRIFKSVGLRWIPTRKTFDSCTGKVDSELTHGSNVNIPNIHVCKQTLDLSAGTSLNGQKQQRIDLSAGYASSEIFPPAYVKEVEEICVTVVVPHPYTNALPPYSSSSGSGSLPSNTVANPRELVECLALADLGASITDASFPYGEEASLTEITILSTSSPPLTPFEEGNFILEEIEACLTNDSIPPGIDDDDFDLEGDLLLLEKLLNDDPSSPLPSKELHVEEN
ncbi:hypothetical protein Tco_0743169, partial [Tanacetum coccineum]